MSPLKAACALALATALSLAAAPAHAADEHPDVWTELNDTYTATGAYAYEPFGIKAGYARTETCASSAAGGMGYHYLNKEYLNSLDPATPAALLYETGAYGKRKLVAVEWVVEDTGQAKPPTLFGKDLDNTVLPGFYTLHAWIYKPNPSGLFEPWNPKVKCP
ncbi:hypothetical protein OG266_18130 [Streptomyces sp. NBC_00554]|uniref:hypothetical protein n=1 Tax=Streptomyces sp. NBC_00554 TaxID=2903661 RepID=UPI00352CD63E|nr:hypothetical protein OG266_18130 [Streptomyces sp. NBC_00554]